MQCLLQAIAIYFLSTWKFTLALPPLVWQNQSSNGLNTRPVNPVTLFPFCNAVYGRDLEIASCLNAWAKIYRLAPSQAYGPRPRFHFDPPPDTLTLPVRYLSDDGLCSIDLQNNVGSQGDTVSGLLISQEARSIIDECVRNKKRGGNIHDIGNPFLFINALTLCRGCPPMAQCHPTVTLNPIPYIVMPHLNNHKVLPHLVCADRGLLSARSSTGTSDHRQTVRAACRLSTEGSPSAVRGRLQPGTSDHACKPKYGTL